jgi:Ca-activated chloride channel family protein
LRLRYKRPEDGMNAASRLIERPLHTADIETAERASQPFRLAAAVAGFGQLLRGGSHTGHFNYTDVERLARSARGDDRHGYAGELLQLVATAQGLAAEPQRVSSMEE